MAVFRIIFDLLDYILSTLAAAGFLGIGGWLVSRTMRQLRFWPKTTATIVRYWISRNSEGQRFYQPVMRFRANEGNASVAISSVGLWRRPWAAGTTVIVRYNPANPRQAQVACFGQLWGLPLTFVGMGVGWAFFCWCRWHYGWH